MDKISIIFLLLIHCANSFCQNIEFNRVPLKGNIESYKRFNSNGKLTEEGKSDRNGRPIFWWYEEGEDVIQSKTKYTKDSIYNYSCFCKNIDSLMNEFKFTRTHDFDSNENPSSLTCEIEVLNSNGLISNKYQFEYDGHYSGENIYIYNDSNKLIAEFIKDKNDCLKENVTINYDNNGKLLFKKYTINEDFGGERTEFIIDSNNLLKSLQKFWHNKLISEFSCIIINDSRTQKYIYKSDSFPKGYVAIIKTFDNKFREIKTIELNSKGNETERTEKIYYKNGNLKLLSFYEANNTLVSYHKYKYDKQNNCTFILVKYINLKTKKYTKLKYKQEIVYYN